MPRFISETLKLKFFWNFQWNQIFARKRRLSNRVWKCNSKHMNVLSRDYHSFAVNAGVDIRRGFPIPHNAFFTQRPKRWETQIGVLVWGQCLGIKSSSGLYLQPSMSSAQLLPSFPSSLFGLRAQSIFFSSVVRLDRQLPREPSRRLHSLTVREHDAQVTDAQRGADSLLWR